MRSIRSSVAIVPLVGLFVAACSDSTGTAGKVPVSLTISTRQAAALALASAGPLTVDAAANVLVITKAQVVLDEIELKASATAVCTDMEEEDHSGPGGGDEEDDDCEEMKLDPMLVDLPVDGVTQLNVDALVPPGTYRELEFKIDAVESGEHASAATFLAAHPDFRNVAVRVEGTFNGQPFVFISHEDAKFELEFEPPVEITAGSSNVTVLIDVLAWFKNASGDFVDPANAGNAALINGNIKRSFHAFEDDDHDGEDDHHGSNSGPGSHG
jgi:hypothetical protein